MEKVPLASLRGDFEFFFLLGFVLFVSFPACIGWLGCDFPWMGEFQMTGVFYFENNMKVSEKII